MSTQKTNSQFLEEAKALWGDKIDFSKTQYVKGHEKALFICPEHGPFRQYPTILLRGHGCQKCGWNSWKTKVLGVGINDLNLGTGHPTYKSWMAMLQRCYSEQLLNKYPSYRGCSVCEEWLTLSNFKRWYDENYIEGYQLDKDILVKGNKVYSPETACFVPKELNILMKTSKRNKHGLPIGVTIKCKKFVATGILGSQRIWIGGFNTPEEAFYAYKERKEQYVKELALEYFEKGLITERVKNALLNYQVEITD